MRETLIHKVAICIAITTFLTFLGINQIKAQAVEQSGSENIIVQELNYGDVVWSGRIQFIRNKSYVGTSQGNYRENISMLLGADLEYVRLLDKNWGVGGKAFFETFFAEGFESATLLYVGAGPVVRRYVFQQNRIQAFGQLNLLLGYDMALGEANGGSGNSEFRYRTGLRIGGSYRFSSSAAVFLSIGPDWEGDDGGFDAKGVELEIGIQLFRF